MSTAQAERPGSETATGNASDKNVTDGRYSIRVLDRAFGLLRLLSDGSPRTLTRLSAESGLNPSTTFRLLSALGSHNYARHDLHTGEYSLGYACLDVARAYLCANDIYNVALPYLQALRDDTRETVHLAVLDRMEIVYIGKLEGLYAIGLMTSLVGGRNPSYCTGLGKVMLAYADPGEVRVYFETHGLVRRTDTTLCEVDALMRHLEEIRSQGLAFDRGEHQQEVRCVAAPVFDARGKAVAALSVSGPRDRMDPVDANLAVIERTVDAARRISAELGYRPSKPGRR